MENEKGEKGKEHIRMYKEIEVGPDEVEAYKNQGFELKLARMYKEADVHHDQVDAHEKDGYRAVGESLEEHKGEHNKEAEKHKGTPTRR